MSFLLYSSVWYVFLLIYITLMILDIFDAVSYFICVHILVFSSFLYIIQFRFHLKLMISFSVSTICFSFFHIFTERWIHKLQSVFGHSDTILSQKTLEKKTIHVRKNYQGRIVFVVREREFTTRELKWKSFFLISSPPFPAETQHPVRRLFSLLDLNFDYGIV